MIVVDTSVWIDYFTGQETPQAVRLDALIGRERLVTGDIILLEVLQGFRDDLHLDRAVRLLRRAPVVPMLGEDRALQAAARYRRLRARGITIRKTADLIIGSWCIDEKVPLLHADRDFDRLAEHEGLMSVS